MKHNNQTYYVEPFKELALEKAEDFKCYSLLQDADEETPGEPEKDILSLRDYDEEKLEEVYQPYKAWGSNWLKEHTVEHDKHIYYVELFKTLKDLENYAKETKKEDDPGRDNLFIRGYSEKKKWFRFKIERFDRVGYDLSRWTGSDVTYNTLFSTKERNVEKEK